MRASRGLLLPLLSTAAFAFAAACSDSNDGAPPSNDAGSDSSVADASADASPDADGDAGPDGGLAPTKLAAGQVVLHGVTTDDHAIYTRVTAEGRVLEAVRTSDGHITTLVASLPEAASVSVKGVVVAVWTDVENATALGTLSFGTAEGTFRQNVATKSSRDMFWASADGHRVAFYANASVDQGTTANADLVVSATENDGSTTTLADDERVALDIDACAPRLGFVKDTLVGAYCSRGTTTARLVTVANAATSARRVLVDSGLTPFWSADAEAAKVFVIAEDQHEGRIVTNAAPVAVTALETDVNEGFLMKDGSAAVYRKGTTLRRAPLGGGAPVTVATGDARRILDVSVDQSTVLFHALPGRPVPTGDPNGERYVDLLTVPSSATEAAPRTLVATERALVLGLSPSGAHAFYFSSGSKLSAVAADGSGERSMNLDFTFINTAPTGSAAVLWKRTGEIGTMGIGEIAHANFAEGADGRPVVTPLAAGIPTGAFHFGSAASHQVVYVRAAGAEPGLYVQTLP